MNARDIPTCEVCLIEYNEERQTRVLHCGHSLCVQCLASLMSTNNKCATCRAPISRVTISRNFQLEDAITYIKEHAEPEVACASCKKNFQVKSMMMCVTCYADQNPARQRTKTVPISNLPFCPQCLIRCHVQDGHKVSNYQEIHEQLAVLMERNEVMNGRVKKQWLRDAIGTPLLEIELEKQTARLQEKKEREELEEKRRVSGHCETCLQAIPSAPAPASERQTGGQESKPAAQPYQMYCPQTPMVAQPLQRFYPNPYSGTSYGHLYYQPPTLNPCGMLIDAAGHLIQESYDGNTWIDVPSGCRYVRFLQRLY